MARLQILELPSGMDDDRPPFVLVIDEATEDTIESLTPVGISTAELVGARTVMAFRETVHIPANGTPAPACPGEGPNCGEIADCDGQCCDTRDADDGEHQADAVAKRLSAELAEARRWARAGYEIGQRHCSWTDHGAAPAWLTEGWPNSFDSCEHLKKAAEYDTALGRVLEVAASLESAEAHGGAWDANQQAAQRIRVAVGRTLPDEEGRP
jgi:hypothetical protein